VSGKIKPDDPRPAKGGWAPGDYMNTCTTCGAAFTGCDKRSWTCADCAYAKSDAPMTPDDNKELVEIVARALAEFWGVNLDKHPDLIGQQARIALTAIESSGRRIVPSFPRVEDVRREALEEAAEVADQYARLSPLFNHGTQLSRSEEAAMDAAARIALEIRALSPVKDKSLMESGR